MSSSTLITSLLGKPTLHVSILKNGRISFTGNEIIVGGVIRKYLGSHIVYSKEVYINNN